MKINKLLFLLTLVVTISCNKKEDLKLDDEKLSTITIMANLEGDGGLSYDESFARWKELKKENGNSYIFQRKFISWTGSGNTTELRIENGIIVERNYEEYKDYWNVNQREIIDSYSETYVNLGSHEKGFSLRTIDDLYNSCPEYLSVDPTNNTIYFRTELNGLMISCGYRPNNCMDDCNVGVGISSFIWI